MSPMVEKLTELLSNKSFKHNGKEYCFMSCKQVVSNVMILTNKETLQIPIDQFNNFYEKVERNCSGGVGESFVGGGLVPGKDLKADVLRPGEKIVLLPESSRVFDKLNNSFENLIDAIDNASEDGLKTLEVKAKMLTSVAQTAINMENSRNNLIKIIQGK